MYLLGTNVNNADLRVIKTKRILKDGLCALLLEKPLEEISVQELCTLTKLNRGTFYLHYKNIRALVENIENEFFYDFISTINAPTTSNIKKVPYTILSRICDFFYKNKELCQIFLSENGDKQFAIKFKKAFKENSEDIFLKTYNIEYSDEFDFYYSYFANGFAGILTFWFEHPELNLCPHDIAVQLESLFANGISGINKLKKK